MYYPVRNRDFREWRKKHQRGGDFVIFSHIAIHELARPIVLEYPAPAHTLHPAKNKLS